MSSDECLTKAQLFFYFISILGAALLPVSVLTLVFDPHWRPLAAGFGVMSVILLIVGYRGFIGRWPLRRN
jgi:hypothetical protein